MYASKVFLIVPVFIVAVLFLFSVGAVTNNVQGRFISAGHGTNNNLQSLNWGGYVVASNQTALNSYNSTYAKPDVIQVNASWIVQTALKSPKSVYSAQWVGIGGFFSGDNSLIQTGTESDYSGHAASYGAWYELLPASETAINMKIEPGDHMYASISLVPGTTNQWKIVLKDITENEQFTTTVTYNSSKLSGEYIEERPELCTVASCSLSTLADFGTAYYGKGYTGVNNTNIATIANTSAYIGDLPYTNITMVSSSGSVLAAPSALTYNGSSFTMTYEGSSSSTVHKAQHGPNNSPKISIIH
ncbi:MAG: hypothetical protein QXS81_05325 [Candidatus Micrarchaeaceae archaeon]